MPKPLLQKVSPGVPSSTDAPWAADVLEMALDAAMMALWEVDLVTHRMRGSPGLHRLLDRDAAPHDWTLGDIENSVFPDDLDLFRASIASALQEGTLRCELRTRRRNGRIAWLAMLGRVTVGEQGRPERLVGVLQDVTARKSSERFLGERESQWISMFETGSIGMAQIDLPEGRLLLVNERLCAMLGYRAEQLAGRPIRSLMHPDDREAAHAGLHALSRGEAASYSVELRMLTRRGDTIVALLAVNAIRDASGSLSRASAVFTDLSEHRQASRDLQQREAELTRLQHRLIDENPADLAEANSALQVEIAERRLAEDQVRELLMRQVQAVEEERTRIARELHDSLGQHLAALALGLRAIKDDPSCPKPIAARVGRATKALQQAEEELDRLSYELRPLALDDLGLDDALRSHVKHWSDDSGVAVELHTHGLRTGRLPALVETTVYRVVQEALTNVRKHAHASRVAIIVERRLDELRVVVEDDGRGFDPEGVESERGRHVGLRGMAERARLVGGALEVESLSGRGTTLYLVVSLRDGPPPMSPA